MKFRLASVMVGAVLISGCVSVGQDFEMADVDRMQPMVTTFEQVKEILGKPQSISSTPDGGSVAGWVRSKASPVGASSKSVMIMFDKNAKFIRVVNRHEAKTN